MAIAKARTSRGSIPYAAAIGLKAADRIELSDQVQQGLPFKSYRNLMRQMDLSSARLADLVQISERTLTRRRKAGRLKPDESERVLRYSRLFTMAVELFDGDPANARAWLSSGNRALRGRSPLEAGKTEIGAREVEHLIVRLEHGVYS